LLPERRITAIAPVPAGVARATIVSSLLKRSGMRAKLPIMHLPENVIFASKKLIVTDIIESCEEGAEIFAKKNSAEGDS